MPKFEVAVYWRVSGKLIIEAETESEAIEKAWDGNVCQVDGKTIKGSWHVDAGNTKEIKEE